MLKSTDVDVHSALNTPEWYILRLFANVSKAKIEILSDYKRHCPGMKIPMGLSGRRHCEMKEVWTRTFLSWLNKNVIWRKMLLVGDQNPESSRSANGLEKSRRFDVCVKGKYLKRFCIYFYARHWTYNHSRCGGALCCPLTEVYFFYILINKLRILWIYFILTISLFVNDFTQKFNRRRFIAVRGVSIEK